MRIAIAFVTVSASYLLSVPALATPQSVSFSIDYGGPTISLPDFATSVPITEADVLIPGLAIPLLGPLPQPSISITGGPGGLGLASHPGCVGHPPGTPCGIEVDALSYGTDQALPDSPTPPGTFWFSVDEFAAGLPGILQPPSLMTEGVLATMDAGADLFIDFGLPQGPLPPFAVVPVHTGALDGNGFFSGGAFAYPGLGLLEWNPPGPPPDLGDNLDAANVDGGFTGNFVFFSLDSAFPDPVVGAPNTGSAVAHGFVGGDILVTPIGGLPGVYAPATVIGLDRLAGPDTDDLDALVVAENGIPGYQPSGSPFDWLGGQTDMVLFSVRRGSAVIGQLDSITGTPIEEGDILTTPLIGSPISPFPGILIAAENIGLATLRSGGAGPFGADDLDALDVIHPAVMDCNTNFVEDAFEIASGAVPDCNLNGIPDPCDLLFGLSNDFNTNAIPDECEAGLAAAYCTAKVNSSGCTPMIGAFGTPSVTHLQPYLVSAVNMISRKATILIYGYAPGNAPFFGGTLCIGPPVRRTAPVVFTGGVWPPNNCTGASTFDFNARIQSGLDPALTAGTTVYAQYWGRDGGSTFAVALSDGLSFTIAP